MRWKAGYALPDLMIRIRRSCDGGRLSLEEQIHEQFQQRFGEALVTEWLPILPWLPRRGDLRWSISAAECLWKWRNCCGMPDRGGKLFPEPLFDGRFRLLPAKRPGGRSAAPQGDGWNPSAAKRCWMASHFNIDTTCWLDNGVRDRTGL